MSINGKDKVLCDSLGNYHVRRGTHHLGLHSVRLVRFNRLDSTYQVLDNSPDPDSVTVSGGSVFCWGIFYGINLEIRNNAKVFEESSLRWEFTQAARDSLAHLPGTWNNRLIATVHQIDRDSLHATLPGLTAKGVLTNAHIDIRDAGRRVWALSRSVIETADSATQIPVWKRVVLVGANAFFVEAFSPAQVAGLPSGSLYHNAVFGENTTQASGTPIINWQFGGVYAMGATGGTADSISYYTQVTTADKESRFAIYKWVAAGDAGNVLVDSTAKFTALFAGDLTWRSQAVIGNATLTASQNYYLVGWSAAGAGGFHQARFVSNAAYLGSNKAKTYAGAGWQDPLAHTVSDDGTWRVAVYCTYTESGAAATPKRRRRLLMPTQGMFIKESQKTFAGDFDELEK